MELVKKITGGGAARVGSYQKQDGHVTPRLGVYQPPPFIGTWEQMRGRGKKKNSEGQRSTPRTQFPIQKCTRLRNHTIKPKFQKNIPTSNHDLLEWCCPIKTTGRVPDHFYITHYIYIEIVKSYCVKQKKNTQNACQAVKPLLEQRMAD